MEDVDTVVDEKHSCEGWREPWSSGYGRRLVFRMSLVQIPAPYTRWTFSHIFAVTIVMMFV